MATVRTGGFLRPPCTTRSISDPFSTNTLRPVNLEQVGASKRKTKYYIYMTSVIDVAAVRYKIQLSATCL